jgi:hypothetical protein
MRAPRVVALNPPIYAVALGAAVLDTVTLLVRLAVDGNDYTALGIFFRLQIPNFDLCFAFFSLCHLVFPNYLFFGLFVCVVSLTPKSICCPPLTSFSGIRSSR